MVLRIFVNGIFILNKIAGRWTNERNIDFDFRELNKRDLDLLNDYLKSIGFSANVNVYDTDIESKEIIPDYSDHFNKCFITFVQNYKFYNISFNYHNSSNHPCHIHYL